MSRLPLGLLLVTSTLMVLGGCSSDAGTPSTKPAPPRCGAPQRAVPSQDPHLGPGVIVGPLQFTDYPYRDGHPTKVIVGTVRTLTEPATLTGASCTTGAPLHFFYARKPTDRLVIDGTIPGETTKRYSEQALETAGQAMALFAPQAAHTEYTGYIIFPRRGTYLVTLRTGGQMWSATLVAALGNTGASTG